MMGRGTRLCLPAWYQGDKSGQTTADCTFQHTDLCQDTFHIFYDLSKDLTNVSPKAPAGHLLVKCANSQNDHAGVELKRVGYIELEIRALLDDDDYTINRATCTHHKLGFIAEEAVGKCAQNILEGLVGDEKDKRIKEFSSNNMVDMFQRQLALLFGHHTGAYVFGNGVIGFPKWFGVRFPDLHLHKMKRQVGSRHGVLLRNAMVHYAMFDPYR